MKLLVVILVGVGIAGLLISWLATTYSRERRSIERYSQAMGVIQKVSEEAGEAEAPIHHAAAQPHIKVVGGAKPLEPPPQSSFPHSMPPSDIAKALAEQAMHPRGAEPIDLEHPPVDSAPEPPRRSNVPRYMPPAEIAKALAEQAMHPRGAEPIDLEHPRGAEPIDLEHQPVDSPAPESSFPHSVPPSGIAGSLAEEAPQPPTLEMPRVGAGVADAPQSKADASARSQHSPMVFDERAGMVAGEEETASWRSASGANLRLKPRFGRFAGVAAAIIVVALLGYFAVGKLSGKQARSTSATTAPPRASATTTTAPPRASTTTTTSTTTSTTAVPSVILPVSSTAGASTFSAPSGSYTVVVSATAPCWVAQSTTVGGNISWDAVLQAGQSHTFSVSGNMVLRSGASTFMNVTLNGVPVKYNSPPGAYDLIFSTNA
ncbi:MAG: DUF4115 domain-containing protein [Nitrospiraceae bacterium]|nr:DUF4115 domain-containing protein [Nitrospiraceae bacterium]